MPDITGREVADLLRTLAEVRKNPAALNAIRDAGTSCIQWADALKQFLRPGTVKPIYVRNQGPTITRPQDLAIASLANKLRESKCVLLSLKFPGSRNHAFFIEPTGGGKAKILHGWQDMHPVRVEEAMAIDEMVNHLRRLPNLDHVSDRAEIQNIRGRLWGADHAEIPDIGTGSRRRISFEMILEGVPDGPLMSPTNRSRVSSLCSDLSEWQSARSSTSRASEWRSARSSLSAEGEPHGARGRGGISVRWGTGVGAGLGFVFGAGGVLLVGVIKGEKIDYAEVGLAGLKNGLAGGAGGAAGAAVAKAVVPTFGKIGVSVVRANAVAGVAMFGVFAIWDVVEWKVNKITDVQLRQRLAEGAGAAGGGILAGAGAGAIGGVWLGPIGAAVGGVIGGIAGGVGGMFAAKAIDKAIWDESEDSIMNSYEFFGWRDVKRKTRPTKTAEEMGRAYDKQIGKKPKKIKEEDWHKICLANLMVLLPAMFPEFKAMMQLANDLKENKSDALSAIGTAFYEYLQEE